MNFEDFKDPEFQEKLRNAANPEKLFELAKEAGLELSDEQLDVVSGGVTWDCFDVKGCLDVCARWDEIDPMCEKAR